MPVWAGARKNHEAMSSSPVTKWEEARMPNGEGRLAKGVIGDRFQEGIEKECSKQLLSVRF